MSISIYTSYDAQLVSSKVNLFAPYGEYVKKFVPLFLAPFRHSLPCSGCGQFEEELKKERISIRMNENERKTNEEEKKRTNCSK